MKLTENRRGWLLCAPTLAALLLVIAYPLLYALWLSLFRHDLRFAGAREFVGLGNYLAVLGSEVWWRALFNTLFITAVSVFFELLLGLGFALVMHRVVVGRRLVRSSLLVPYAMISVVAALAFKFAFDPTVGFVNGLLGLDQAWLNQRGSAFFVIIFGEIWKTTPFMALLLLAGLALIPEDLHQAARIDGATARQRFFHITLPLLRPAILSALLFRTLDALRVFDMVFMLTRGAHGTEPISLIAYNTLIVRLNLGLGSAVSVLIFLCALGVAALFIRGLRA